MTEKIVPAPPPLVKMPQPVMVETSFAHWPVPPIAPRGKKPNEKFKDWPWRELTSTVTVPESIVPDAETTIGTVSRGLLGVTNNVPLCVPETQGPLKVRLVPDCLTIAILQ